MSKIGIDLGGTKIEGILLDKNLNIVERKRIPTQQENGYKSIVDSIISLVKELKSKSSDDVTIGISAPGAISKKTGLIKNSNTQCLIGQPLKEDLVQALNQEIIIDNDANCFAKAESVMGSAKNYNLVFGIILT